MIVVKTSIGAFVTSARRDRAKLFDTFTVVRVFNLDHLHPEDFEDPFELESRAVMIAKVLDQTVVDIDQTNEIYNLPFSEAKRVFRKRYMDKAVARYDSYIEASKALGINRRTLYRWLDKLEGQ